MSKSVQKYPVSYKSLIGKFKKDTVPNLILLSLREKILLDDIVKIICGNFVGKNFDPAYNLVSFSGDDKAIYGILNECSNTGLFSDKKVVVLKNIKKLLKDEKLALIEYFKNSNPDTCLIMVSADEEFSPGKLFFYDSKAENEKSAEYKSAVEKNVTVYEISDFSHDEMVSWIKEKFEDYKIEEPVINQFLQYSNYSFDEILTEIEKLKTYCYNSKEVKIEDVNLCNGIAKDFKETDFIRAVVNRENGKALMIYDKISLKKDVEVFLVFLLNAAFIIINKLSDPAVSRLQGFNLKRELKLWLPGQEELLPHYRKFGSSIGQEKIRNAFGYIYSADKSLKTSSGSKRTVMTSLINNICSL